MSHIITLLRPTIVNNSTMPSYKISIDYSFLFCIGKPSAQTKKQTFITRLGDKSLVLNPRSTENPDPLRTVLTNSPPPPIRAMQTTPFYYILLYIIFLRLSIFFHKIITIFVLYICLSEIFFKIQMLICWDISFAAGFRYLFEKR